MVSVEDSMTIVESLLPAVASLLEMGVGGGAANGVRVCLGNVLAGAVRV